MGEARGCGEFVDGSDGTRTREPLRRHTSRHNRSGRCLGEQASLQLRQPPETVFMVCKGVRKCPVQFHSRKGLLQGPSSFSERPMVVELRRLGQINDDVMNIVQRDHLDLEDARLDG